MVLVNHIEMARVTGVPASFLLTRWGADGQHGSCRAYQGSMWGDGHGCVEDVVCICSVVTCLSAFEWRPCLLYSYLHSSDHGDCTAKRLHAPAPTKLCLLYCCRGQSIKVFSQLLRKARSKNLLIPNMDKNKPRSQGGGAGADVAYEGATVLEPKIGMSHVLVWSCKLLGCVRVGDNSSGAAPHCQTVPDHTQSYSSVQWHCMTNGFTFISRPYTT